MTDPAIAQPAAIQPVRFDPVPDIRLLAVDMDGTLLDADHTVPRDFWPLVDQLYDMGIVFCPASGRQYWRLRDMFAPVADEAVFVADNGAYVVRAGQELSSDGLSRSDVHAMIARTRQIIAEGGDIGIAVAGKRAGYVEQTDPRLAPFFAQFLHRMEVVSDLMDVEDDFLKIAIYDFHDADRVSRPAFAEFAQTHTVVATGKHWLDIMSKKANKGAAIRHVQQTLGVTRDQTMVFGDFLNDLEMMDEATYSFAMGNAHPEVVARARYRAPANTENGVVRAIRTALSLDQLE